MLTFKEMPQWGISLIIGIAVVVAVLLLLYINPFKDNQTQQTQLKTEQTLQNNQESALDKDSPKQNMTPNQTPNTVTEPPDNTGASYNGGIEVPENILANILDAPTETSGVVYENDKKTSIYIYADQTLVDKVRSKCDGGGVRNPSAPPKIQGGYNEPGEKIYSEMILENIGGKDRWVKRGIQLNQLKNSKLFHCIFIGYSLRGNYDKYLHDEYKRQGRGVIPGSYDNNAEGMNCWTLIPGR